MTVRNKPSPQYSICGWTKPVFAAVFSALMVALCAVGPAAGQKQESISFVQAEAGLNGVVGGASSVADVNEDGNQDLLITSEQSTKLYLGDGQGGFTEASADLPAQDVPSNSAPIADVNGDGHKDILLTTVGLYLGDGEGGFSKANAGLIEGGAGAIADLNEDGNQDIVIAGSTITNVYIGDGQGGFTKTEELEGVLSGFGPSVSVEDIDENGHLDILLTGLAGSEEAAILYSGDGEGGFTETSAGIVGVSYSSTSVADVDDDGNNDLLVTGQNESALPTTTLYLGDGEGGFQEEGAGLTGAVGGSNSIADVNGDGNPDILVTGQDGVESSIANLYLGDGEGGFTVADAGLSSVSDGSTSIKDVNDDNNKDILITGGGTANLYLNQGSASKEPPTDLQATAGDGQVELTWNSGGDSSPAGYNVYRSTSSFSDNSNATKLNGSPINSTIYTDTEVTNGTTYFYRVTLVDGDGNESGLSGEASATPQLVDLNEGLVAYYPFDGNADDASGNENDGTLRDNPQFGSGYSDQAVTLDGDDDFVDLQSDLLPANSDFSYFAWIRQTNSGNHQTIYLNSGTGACDFASFGVDSTDQLDVRLGCSPSVSTSDLSIQKNQWTFVGIVHQAGSEKYTYYKNEKSQTVPGPVWGNGESNTKVIGAVGFLEKDKDDPAAEFTGKVDEARIYDRALTESEVQQLYNDDLLLSPTDLQATAGDGQVELTWNSGGDSSPAGYNVYRSTSSFSDTSNASKINDSIVSGTSFTDAEVTNGTEYFYRVTAVNDDGNESNPSGEVSATPSAGGGQTLSIGALTIYADQIQNTSGSTYEVSGNVSVDQALFLEGTVTVDTEALSIEGNGEIFLSGVPDEGIVTLYDGPYGFTLPSDTSTVLAGDGLDVANTLFSVAGLGVQIGGLEVLDDGVRVEGQLQLPKLLGTIKPEISSLQITESDGLDFTGSIEVEKVELKDGVAELEELSLEYASAENRFTGSASLVTPPFGLMAGTQIIGGRLDSVGVDIAVSPPVPIANTGLGLAGGGGFVSGLVKPPTALGINADITPLTGNTEVVTLADLSLKYRFDTLIKGGGRVEIFEQGVGGASLTVSARKAAFEGRLGLSVPTADANVLEGNLNASVSRAAAPDVDLLASGGLSASLQIPDIGDGFPYGWISSFAGLPYRVANTGNTLRAQPLNATGRFKGETTIGGGIPGVSGYGIAYGVAYDQGDLSASFADNMENLNDELFPMPALALKSAVREENRFEGQSLIVGTGQPNRLLKSLADTLRQSFTLQRETPSLIIRVQRDAGMPGYTITSPSERIVSAEGAGSIPNISYSEAPDQNKAFYSIKNPRTGEWSINVPDDGTEHAIDVIGATPAPTLDLDPPEANGQTVSLNWQLTALEGEATVDLYYDRDRSGRDGVSIAEELPEDQTSFSWDTSSLPTGTYYVYAVARNGKNAPQVVYAKKPIEVTQSGAPMPPEGVSASAQDTALVVGWNERDAASRYTVYYAEGEDPSFQSRRLGVGDTTKVALDRIPSGRTYHVAVTASDTSGRESRLSGAAAATFESQSENNAPQITTADPKTIARKGKTYSQQVSATDADGDALNYTLTRGPDGMSIGNSGQISWSPTPGTYRVGVRVKDGQGGADSLDYQLTALDRQGAVARVSFSQPTYFGSQVGQLIVEDPALNASPSAIDSQEVQVRSDANPQGTEVVLRETSANSGRLQGSFGLGEEASESPAVSVEPVDSVRVIYEDSDPDTSITAFAWFYEQEPPRTAPFLVSPRAGGVASTQPTLSWEEVGAAEMYRVQVAEDSTFQSLVLEETTSSPELGVERLEEETTYYWRVRAESVVNGPWSAPTTFLTRAQRVPVAVERSFGEADGPGDYRLVGLPGEASRPLGTAVRGEAGTRWQAFWDDGSSEDYFRKYDGSDTFTFVPGRGFWLTSQQSWSVEDSISAVPLKNGSTASIPVREGWNIVANPLGRDVAWSAIVEANGGDLQPIWAFDGSFAEADTFRSARVGEAFYFLNDTGLDSLKIPYPTGSIAKSQATSESRLLTIKARPKGGNGPTSAVKVGFDREAAEGFGRLDEPAPPGRFSGLSLRLKLPGDAPPRRRSLMTEQRPPTDGSVEGHTFDLQLWSKMGESVQITADGLSAIRSDRAKLLVPSTGRSYDLVSGKSVSIEEADSTALRLAIGSASYVEDQARQIVPDEVSLTSYPNPTRGQATVEYTLPEAKKVTLEVYDVLGRRVAVLEKGQKQAGRHTATLSGRGLSSGVYFGRLKAGERTLTQKITVVR